MNAWVEEGHKVLNLIVRKPDTPLEIAVTAVLSFALFLTIMWLAGQAFKMPYTNLMQRILAGIVFAIAGVAAATAASVLAAPRVEKEVIQKAIMIAAPIVAILAIGVPLAMLTMRAKYFQTLFTVGLSIAAAWGISLLSEGIFDSVKEGIKQANKAGAHKEEIDKVIDSNATTPGHIKPGRDRRSVAAQKKAEEVAAAEKAAREKALREGK